VLSGNPESTIIQHTDFRLRGTERIHSGRLAFEGKVIEKSVSAARAE
jgi:hypothetical protein